MKTFSDGAERATRVQELIAQGDFEHVDFEHADFEHADLRRRGGAATRTAGVPSRRLSGECPWLPY
ncbi:MAG: hypothetical protein IPK64_18605 [bacterium]|nr:hypothetical protein [bacterium]